MQEQWLAEKGLAGNESAVQSLMKTDLTVAIAWMWGNIPFEDNRIICDTLMWVAVFDDFCVRNNGDLSRVRPVLNRVIGMMRDPDTWIPKSGPEAAWLDIWARAKEGGMSAEWRARCLRDWEDYFQRLLEETEEHAADVWAPDVQVYLQKRVRSYAYHMFLDLGERGNDIELPSALLGPGHLEDMAFVCFAVCCIVNDVVSLEREESEGERNNIVIQLTHGHGMRRDAAIAESQRMVARFCQDFVTLKAGVPAWCASLGMGAEVRERLDRYIAMMERIMRGNYEWHRALPGRYLPENHTESMKEAYLSRV
ncbi:terpene synthase family protein [Burkholderia orbicola]|uniref:terpene synthase family protein n=1 Tax=Burkholderia orbicola TaxID=2978683 RepID=UPI002FDFDE3D